MRLALGIVVVVVVGCASPPESGSPYLDDPVFRRDELVRSLVNPDNGYSQLRLANYARADGSGWDALDEWNPLGLPIDGVEPSDDTALRALGEAAFSQYPMELLPTTLSVEAYGGARVQRVAASTGLTCSTCHATEVTAGLANARFDLGHLLVDAGMVTPTDAPAFRAWGPGRVDVTTDHGTEPVRIPDLRAVAWLTYLQADATVRQRDLVTLAVRIETLIITSLDQQHRPPRIVALALATYLRSLADTLPPLPASTARGATVFATTCAGCHAPPGLTGDPIPLEDIGTDPIVGRSAQRGTGTYRVPSLHGVGARALLLHDGSLPSLDAMFDPARTGAVFTGGVRPGPVLGHDFGLDLDATDRADLLAYLETL